MKLKSLIIAVSTLATASAAMGGECGEFSVAPEEMAVWKNGGDINKASGLMTVSIEKPGADEEHGTVKFIANLPSPAESGLNSVTADSRILSGLVHQQVTFAQKETTFSSCLIVGLKYDSFSSENELLNSLLEIFILKIRYPFIWRPCGDRRSQHSDYPRL